MKHLVLFAIIFSLAACGGDPGGGSTIAPNVIAVSDTRDDQEVIYVDDICLEAADSPPDLIVTGSNNSINIVSGCFIRTLKISGSGNYTTVSANVSIDGISFTGEAESNIVNVRTGFSTNVINNVDASNCVLLPGTGCLM